MPKRHIFFLALLVLLGIGLLVYSQKIAHRFFAKSSASAEIRSVIGKYENIQGTVGVRRAGEKKITPLKAQNARDLDRIYVENRSQLDINFDSGYRVSLEPQTEAIIELWDESRPQSPVYLQIVRGDYKLLTRGQPGRLYVVQDKNLFAPSRKPTQKARVMTITPRAATNISRPAAPTPATPAEVSVESEASDGKSLSTQYLTRTLAQYRDQFQRCQTNSLRTAGKASGSIVVALEINPRGHVEHVKTLENRLPSGEFQNCVLSVFERAKFKPFNGPPVMISYPLNFE